MLGSVHDPGMAFTDLPDNWDSYPITDPALLPDVLDLVVSEQARATGALYLLVCDPGDRLVLPMQITELADAPAGPGRDALLTVITDKVCEIEPDAGVLAAVARPGGLSATADDRAWAEALAQACDGRVRLLGVHVVTMDGSRPVPRDARAA